VADRELGREIIDQTSSQGVDHELSLNYHRLVLEMVLHAIYVWRRIGTKVPNAILERALRMVEFVGDYTKPDGDVPLIRDIDNGRFVILGDPALDRHQHVYALADAALGSSFAGPGDPQEDSLWLHHAEPATVPTRQHGEDRYSRKSKAFPESGFYIMRSGDLFSFIVCSPLGMANSCGHAHNDHLSIDLYAYDKTFLTDCGSYVYTRYPEWRNRFRSIASHNTLMIDGIEPNRLGTADVFSIDNDAAPSVSRWESGEQNDILEAWYELNAGGETVRHVREFAFDKVHDWWTIRDRVLGAGDHQIETRFHFGRSVDRLVACSGAVRTVCRSGANLILVPLGPSVAPLELTQGWLSSVYGMKMQIHVAVYRYHGPLPWLQTYALVPVAHQGQERDNPESTSHQDFFTAQKRLADRTNSNVSIS